MARSDRNDDRDHRKVHARADGAAQLIEDPFYLLAYEAIEATVLDSLASTALTDREAEHELVLLLKANRMHRATLAKWVEEGNALGVEQERREPVDREHRVPRKGLM